MKKVSVVISDATFRWLKTKAKEQHRSLGGQVRFFLDSMFDLSMAANRDGENDRANLRR